MGGMGLIFTPVLVRHLKPSILVWTYDYNYIAHLGLIDSPNSPIRRYNPLPASHLPPLPTPIYVQSMMSQY